MGEGVKILNFTLDLQKNGTQKFGVKIKFESINNKQKKVAASNCG